MLILIGVFWIYFGLTYSSWELPYENCMYLFQVTPEEFMNTEFEFYDETGDFRKTAYINKNGNLVLLLSSKQQKAWINSEWLSGFSEYKDKKPFFVSSDLSELTVYVPPTIDPEGEYYQNIWDQVATIHEKIATIHTLSDALYGTETSYTASLKYTIVAETSGEVIHVEYIPFR